jgi:hypothetical protein
MSRGAEHAIRSACARAGNILARRLGRLRVMWPALVLLASCAPEARSPGVEPPVVLEPLDPAVAPVDHVSRVWSPPSMARAGSADCELGEPRSIASIDGVATVGLDLGVDGGLVAWPVAGELVIIPIDESGAPTGEAKHLPAPGARAVEVHRVGADRCVVYAAGGGREVLRAFDGRGRGIAAPLERPARSGRTTSHSVPGGVVLVTVYSPETEVDVVRYRVGDSIVAGEPHGTVRLWATFENVLAHRVLESPERSAVLFVGGTLDEQGIVLETPGRPIFSVDGDVGLLRDAALDGDRLFLLSWLGGRLAHFEIGWNGRIAGEPTTVDRAHLPPPFDERMEASLVAEAGSIRLRRLTASRDDIGAAIDVGPHPGGLRVRRNEPPASLAWNGTAFVVGWIAEREVRTRVISCPR